MLFIFFSILLALIFQMQVLPVLGIRLDLILFVTLYYGFLYGSTVGAGIGMVAGLLQDIFSCGILGASPVGLIICGLLAGYTRRTLFLRYWILRVCLVFAFSALNLAVYLAVLKIFFQADILPVFKNNWLALSIGNAIFAGLIFWLVDRTE